MNTNNKDQQIEKMRNLIEERWEEVLKAVETRDNRDNRLIAKNIPKKLVA